VVMHVQTFRESVFAFFLMMLPNGTIRSVFARGAVYGRQKVLFSTLPLAFSRLAA
jgi:hypothetical protein